ncbi:hypothetical protein NEOLEDRAFT_1119397 [Neolentinus lepideus HHB14362 ss-1]|uniref:Protein BIG1 n=1 Tax=Neolentinus lepideus HHB14362 ss-1 TaxID=1314782 RepID=A0A165QL66_9AGAM|nr:hypothetical protein NEOLEDRAFT_1119397 [Neolentinus lepideus HHB14362 ss-1]
MRIVSSLTLLVASAGLALEQVSASPIRVVVVTSHQELSASGPLRLGHAAANAHPEIAMVNRPNFAPNFEVPVPANVTHKAHQHACAKLRQKAIAMSNGIRKMFGMPLIETPVQMHKQPLPVRPVEGGVKIMGWVENGEHKHNLERPAEPAQNGEVHILEQKMPVMRPHRVGMRCGKATFLRRIHRALMTLGPWEGRAVAFVLGCGIGVIFRMIWVMAVVSYRLIKGRREPEEYDYEVIYETDAEDILVPPPQYTDEKVAAVDVKEAPAPAPEA